MVPENFTSRGRLVSVTKESVRQAARCYRKEAEVVGLDDANGMAKLIWLTKWT